MTQISTIWSRALTIMLVLLPQTALVQNIDLRSYRLGAAASWSESVAAGVKKLALSSPVTPEEMDAMIGVATDIASRFDVSVYRETNLLVTDLFPADVADGKHVLLFYRPPTLDRYLAVKKKKSELVKSGEYSGTARESIAREFGRMLSYPEHVIDQKLAANGFEPSRRATFSGVWKSPGISLDDENWRIADLACRNGCSQVSYEYFRDLIADPANDDVSIVDLYGDTQEFARNYVSSLFRPNTLQALVDYDAANDAALDCTPQGDGLKHQISAPPAIKFEQYPDRVLIRYEYWNAVRTIHLDERRVPSDVSASRLGYSVGELDGAELVIETTRLIPSQISLMGKKFYLSEDARFIERYRLTEDAMRMDLQWTVIDPVNLRGPYTGVMAWLRAPGWELHEWRCEAITGEF